MSTKGFSPFSLVYGTEAVSLTKLMIPSLRVLQAQKKEGCILVERCEDLEGLYENREEAEEHSYRYRHKMVEAYGNAIKERVFVEG